MNQVQQELQNELTTANQLISLILVELQQIKQLTNAGGELESNICQNAATIKKLANIQQIDLKKIPSFSRKQVDVSLNLNQNASHVQQNSFENGSEMEESH